MTEFFKPGGLIAANPGGNEGEHPETTRCSARRRGASARGDHRKQAKHSKDTHHQPLTDRIAKSGDHSGMKVTHVNRCFCGLAMV